MMNNWKYGKSQSTFFLLFRKSFDFDLINKQLVTFNALKNLSLSPYFLKFFGYNINSDPSNFLYFREYLESKNLAILLENSSVKL